MPPPEIRRVLGTRHFDRQVEKASRDVVRAVRETLEKLMTGLAGGTVRLHSISGHKKPQLYKIDVFGNHSHQISLEIHGECAVLLRLGTHAEIDRKPR